MLVARALPQGTLVYIDGVPVRIDMASRCPRCGTTALPMATTTDENWTLIQSALDAQHAARDAAMQTQIATEVAAGASLAFATTKAANIVDADPVKFAERQVIEREQK